MRRNLSFLSKVAHPAYLSGLEKTGISLDYIPDIEDMNARLSKIGWKAVVVDGFVPPAAFMEFQAHKILVISAEIRNIKNILYTPAPDIIHEAAGHAPIIADETYAAYLQKIGEYGAKSVFSKLDYEIYEAIRQLSIIKEYPDASAEEVTAAEQELEQKVAANTVPSESAYLARLHWWTVEYGLIGKTDDFKIYGAGILSSVGESKACLDPSVKKLPLSVETAMVDYDITRMQPQLFVAASFEHLLEVLEEFADSMCFRKGGIESVKQVMASDNVGTVVLDSGLQISGVIDRIDEGSDKHVSFIKTRSETSLAYQDIELDGHGIAYHLDGFSSPLGAVKGLHTPLYLLADEDLARIGLISGEVSHLEFVSGFTVRGILSDTLRKDGKLILLSFTDCTVTDGDNNIIFQPEWGTFDMAVGSSIVSAFSGSADKEKFNVYPPKSEKKAIKVVYNDKQLKLFEIYKQIDDMRAGRIPTSTTELQRLHHALHTDHTDAWLVRLELIELASRHNATSLISELKKELYNIGNRDPETNELITTGLDLYSA